MHFLHSEPLNLLMASISYMRNKTTDMAKPSWIQKISNTYCNIVRNQQRPQKHHGSNKGNKLKVYEYLFLFSGHFLKLWDQFSFVFHTSLLDLVRRQCTNTEINVLLLARANRFKLIATTYIKMFLSIRPQNFIEDEVMSKQINKNTFFFFFLIKLTL